MSEFTEELESVAAKAAAVIDQLPAGDSVTVWELKHKLKTELSPLYIALGMLSIQGIASLSREGLNYTVRPGPKVKPPQQAVGVPLRMTAPESEPAVTEPTSSR